MKKIITIVLFLLSVVLFSESGDFQFYSYGEFAYYPNLRENYEIPNGVYFSTIFATGLEYKNLFVEIRQDTFMTMDNAFYFSPYEQTYYVTVGFSIWAFGMEYEHSCNHEIDKQRMLNGKYDKITLNFDSRRLK